jgi:hypothetical protein
VASLPRLLLRLLLHPRATVENERHLFRYPVAWAFLLGYSAVEALTWVLSGIPRGGDPLKVFFVGEILPPGTYPTTLPPALQYAILFPGKVAGDLLLVTVAHRIATRRLGAKQGSWRELFTTYNYLVAVLDPYFILATGIAILPGERVLATSHALLAVTLALNATLYPYVWARVYRLDDDAAYRWYWLAMILVPATFLVPAGLLVPGGLFR